MFWSLLFCSLWKERNQGVFESKEMSNQVLKSTFLCNLLLLVRMYIDGGSLSMIDFMDW